MPHSLADLIKGPKEIERSLKNKKLSPELRKKRIRAMLAKKTMLGDKKTLKSIAKSSDETLGYAKKHLKKYDKHYKKQAK